MNCFIHDSKEQSAQLWLLNVRFSSRIRELEHCLINVNNKNASSVKLTHQIYWSHRKKELKEINRIFRLTASSFHLMLMKTFFKASSLSAVHRRFVYIW